MLEGIIEIFDNKDVMMKHLKKRKYEEQFELFGHKYKRFFQEMTSFTDEAESVEAASAKIGQIFTEQVKTAFAKKNGKIQSGLQGDLNLFMIYYVFPTILKTNHPHAKQICDGICAKWAETFKGNDISYTDYDTLYKAFREKIFGII